MARIGKQPIMIPPKVKIERSNDLLKFEGPNGTMSLTVPSLIEVEIGNESILVKGDEGNAESRAKRGTIRQLIYNSVVGVTTGFEKVLLLEGVGYRAQADSNNLKLFLGFSHNIDHALPANVTAKVDNNTKITLSSCDKQVLGQTAAEVRAYRPPEPYKGKGVRYENEIVRRKAGKSGKK